MLLRKKQLYKQPYDSTCCAKVGQSAKQLWEWDSVPLYMMIIPLFPSTVPLWNTLQNIWIQYLQSHISLKFTLVSLYMSIINCNERKTEHDNTVTV